MSYTLPTHRHCWHAEASGTTGRFASRREAYNTYCCVEHHRASAIPMKETFIDGHLGPHDHREDCACTATTYA